MHRHEVRFRKQKESMGLLSFEETIKNTECLLNLK